MTNDPPPAPGLAAMNVFRRSMSGAAARSFLGDLAANCGVFRPYIERIEEWRDGNRPRVGPDPRFRINGIVEQWRRMLSES